MRPRVPTVPAKILRASRVAVIAPTSPARCVATGASKGGITAVYHRYLFPDDTDGVVPYVAPASRARIDELYQGYLDTTLTDTCAQRVRSAQTAALTTRRQMMLQHIVQTF